VTTVLVTHDQEEAMDVADRIAVLSAGRIEQVGSPQDLYDRPANDFVMSFLGPVATLDGVMVRPHDLRLDRQPTEGTVPAIVERVVHLGFEVRVELATPAGEPPLSAQITRGRADALGLNAGETVYVRAEQVPALA